LKAIVVYESLWGNTAAIARAIAEGLGPGARALSTGEATAEAIAGADLMVAGAPVFGFRLATEESLQNVRLSPGVGAPPPNMTNPAMRSWLEELAELPPRTNGHCAAFETGLRWSPGGATSSIIQGMERAGFTSLDKGKRFVVKGRFGPLRDGEIERAREWGTELAASLGRQS
jgi:flavorubredoxin